MAVKTMLLVKSVRCLIAMPSFFHVCVMDHVRLSFVNIQLEKSLVQLIMYESMIYIAYRTGEVGSQK